MRLIPISVESYAGHKADETPRRFCFEGVWTQVEEVLDRWHQVQSLPEWPRANYFKVRAPDGHEHLLKHDQEQDQWFLCQRWSPSPPSGPAGERDAERGEVHGKI